MTAEKIIRNLARTNARPNILQKPFYMQQELIPQPHPSTLQTPPSLIHSLQKSKEEAKKSVSAYSLPDPFQYQLEEAKETDKEISAAWQQRSSDSYLKEVVPGNYYIILDEEILVKLSSKTDMLKMVENIIHEHNVELTSLKIVHCLDLKIGIIAE